MKQAHIAIVGGGLSGLYASYLLEQHGFDNCVLFEARSALGGRIRTALSNDKAPQPERFDLGPSWFWPDYQQAMDRVVGQLGLVCFEQFEVGDQVVEPPNKEPPVRMRGYVSMPPSMRLVGGMTSLIDALQLRLQHTRILTGTQVRALRLAGDTVELDVLDAEKCEHTHSANRVLLALPPRLVQHTLKFSPALPSPLAAQWAATPTWMAPHAKYVAVYETPFWREFGLSGAAQSARGPMAEIHDASIPDGKGALFGFFGVAPAARNTVDKDTLLGLCRQQLGRLFGPLATTPLTDFLQDWANEPFTATPADVNGSGEHPEAPASTITAGPWQHRIVAIGSEWSPQFSGYLAGAIEAAQLGVEEILKTK